MVYSLPGVEVSSDKPSTVKICHRGDVRSHVYEWVFTITFEVRETNDQAKGKSIKLDVVFQVLSSLIASKSNELVYKG